VNGRRSGPNESVVPPSNQQIAPALTPVSTMPDSQAVRMTGGRPCTRQTASRLATLPPPTKITSCDSSRSAGSATFGIGNRARWVTSHPVELSRARYRSTAAGSSPTAVASRQIRGRGRPARPAR
jgi:hypothetical protein